MYIMVYEKKINLMETNEIDLSKGKIKSLFLWNQKIWWPYHGEDSEWPFMGIHGDKS